MSAQSDPIPLRPAQDGAFQTGHAAHHQRMAGHHKALIATFLLMFIAPVLVSAWYLWTRAADRYVSLSGFSVRTEQTGSALELLGGVAEMPGAAASDADILARFIESPALVAKADAVLDLRTLWSLPGTDWRHPASDPIFAYHAPGQIEDLTKYWNRRVTINTDTGRGLIEVQVQAFTPEDARALNRLIYQESADMINHLSAIAREDATRYARAELDRAKADLKRVREDMTMFRNRTQIVDPEASVQGQMGLLSSLQEQLAQTLIDVDVLRQSARSADPRIKQAEARVMVIEARIAEEQAKLGLGSNQDGGQNTAFADLIGEYEGLMVDLQFAEQSYAAARASFENALAEAQRKSRYLASHIDPTLPEAALRPHRWGLLAMVAFFAGLAWMLSTLILYAFRDRR